MKYTVITLGNPSRQEYVKDIRNTLAQHEEIFIECVNGKDEEQLNKNIVRHGFQINFDEWKPGEGGIWYSTINAWEYAANNNTDLLVLEDDAELSSALPEILDSIETENLDIISLYSPYGQVKVMPFTLVPCYQEYSNAAIIYTARGAQKIMGMLRDEGLDNPVDIWLFRKVLSGELVGLCPAEVSIPVVKINWGIESNIQNDEKVKVFHPEV